MVSTWPGDASSSTASEPSCWVLDATAYARKAEHRKEIAAAIAPANYLNQPVTVVEQILTGIFADGLGGIQKVPDRIDFDPFPYESFAIRILTQMKRWGQLKGNVDYQTVAKEVFLATDTTHLMKEVGLAPPPSTSFLSWARNSIRASRMPT